MKALRYSTCRVLVIASLILAASACNELGHVIEVPENEYSIDIDNYVDSSFRDLNGPEQIDITVKSPFVATILKGSTYSVDNTQREKGRFTVTPNAIAPVSFNKNAAYARYGNIPNYAAGKGSYSLTRDITLYVRPFELQTVTGFGPFKYPIRIRQRGEDGTYYLCGEQIRKWKDDHRSADEEWFGGTDSHYIKAIITNVGKTEKDEGIRSVSTTASPLWTVPALGESFNEPQNLEAKTITLSVDNEDLTVRIHYPACYNLVNKQQYSVGDTVEVFIPNQGIITDSNVIWISPLDILKL